MSKKSQDIKFGLEKEVVNESTIKSFFKCGDLTKTSKYGIIDFYNSTHYIELKSRRLNYNDYPTTICGYNKIEYFNKLNRICILVFSYLDGLYYINYNKELFKQFEVKEEFIIRDGKKENKINIHIPIKYLNKII